MLTDLIASFGQTPSFRHFPLAILVVPIAGNRDRHAPPIHGRITPTLVIHAVAIVLPVSYGVNDLEVALHSDNHKTDLCGCHGKCGQCQTFKDHEIVSSVRTAISSDIPSAVG